MLKCNTRTLTLRDVVEGVAKKRLAVVTPMLLCGDFLYEEGEGLEEDEVCGLGA
jgi:ubiquitin-like 1-activating enzyme E1 B